jgi:hypothetical protein
VLSNTQTLSISHGYLAFAIFAEQIFFQHFHGKDEIGKAIANFITTPHFDAIRAAVATLFMEQHKFPVWLSEPAQQYTNAVKLFHDKLLHTAIANRSKE